jgi:nickel transport system substrate-binding protein
MAGKKYIRLISCLFGMAAAFSLLFAWSSPCLADTKTLNYSWPSNVGPLNPHLYSPNQMFAQAMVYEPLVRYGEGGQIIPWLAESWEISKDGKEYVFKLRQGVLFSDGTAFDAQAVKKNFDAIMANAKRHDWLNLVNEVHETSTPDNRTFRLVLKNAYYPTLQDLTLIRPFRFLAPSAFPDSGNTAEGIRKPVGTGPWMLAESKLAEYDVFVRNDRHWGEKPKVEKIVVKVIPDPHGRAIAFETGLIDLIFGPGGMIGLDTFKRFADSGKYETRISQPLATRALAVNSNRGPTKDLAVRQAMQHAFNKDTMIKGIFMNTEKKADTLFSSEMPYCKVGLKPFAYSPQQAENLLDGAGWKRSSDKAVRVKAGTELAVDFCFVGNDALQKSIAEAFQSEMNKVGIRVNLLGEENDSFLKRQKTGEFSLIFNDTWGAPYEPHATMSSMRVPSHADFQAQSGLPMKAELDAKITEVLGSVDESQRKTLYSYLLTTLHEQAVYLPLSFITNVFVHRGDLQGVTFGWTRYEIPFEKMEKR